MKRVLIWDLDIHLKNSGGAAGYLYQLKQSNLFQYFGVFFFKDLMPNSTKNEKENIRRRIPNLIRFLEQIDIFHFREFFYAYRTLCKWRKVTSISIPINLNEYDIIHFHSSQDLYCARKMLLNFAGIVILTTHSPEPVSCEQTAVYVHFGFLKRYLEKMILKKELYAWNLAQYILFPVKEAMEPYMINNKISNYIVQNSKFIFCPTSILDENATNTKCTRDNLIKKLGLPWDCFIISYVGRHSIVKGYDQLKLLAQEIFKQTTNVYFIIAGEERPICGLNDERWIELGWIDYASDMIKASDLFILPNKETYFDIVALEVIRAGVPIMMSNTGGNKFFSSLKDDYGIFMFDYGNIDSQVHLLLSIMKQKSDGKLKYYGERNRLLYEKYFTVEAFFYRYRNLLDKLKV